MSGPNSDKKDKGEVLNNILESIMFHKKALAHFLNIETEKINKTIDLLSINEVLVFEQDLASIIKDSMKIQMLLQFRLEKILVEDEISAEGLSDFRRETVIDIVDGIILLETVVDNLIETETNRLKKLTDEYNFPQGKLNRLQKSVTLIIKNGTRIKDSLEYELEEIKKML
ncbi:hypothetical protein [Halanaerobaculum tunisiense]